ARRHGSGRGASASSPASASRKCAACATRQSVQRRRGLRCRGRPLEQNRLGAPPMLSVDADGVDKALTFGALVDTLREAFRAGAVQPVRHHHTVERATGAASTLLLMPAWTDFRAGDASDGHIGVKIVTVSPDNNALGKPAVMGLYLLL